MSSAASAQSAARRSSTTTLNVRRITLTIGSFDHPELFPPSRQDGIEARVPYFASLHLVRPEAATEDGSEAWAAAIKASSHQHPDHDTETWPPAAGFGS